MAHPELRAPAPAHTPAPPRRFLAPNVIALWPEDRPPVVNPRRRGRYPRGVEPLRRWDRLHVGDYAYLWSDCPHNRGLVVKLLRRYPDGQFLAEAVTGLIKATDGTLTERADAPPAQLRRCRAPR